MLKANNLITKLLLLIMTTYKTSQGDDLRRTFDNRGHYDYYNAFDNINYQRLHEKFNRNSGVTSNRGNYSNKYDERLGSNYNNFSNRYGSGRGVNVINQNYLSNVNKTYRKNFKGDNYRSNYGYRNNYPYNHHSHNSHHSHHSNTHDHSHTHTRKRGCNKH